MGIDLKAINADIRRLQRLKEFAKDFENDGKFAEMVLKYITNRSTSNSHEEVSDEYGAGDNGSGSSRPRGYLQRAIIDAVNKLPISFTTDDVQAKLEEATFVIKAANPNIAINETLRVLEKRELVARDGKVAGTTKTVWKRLVIPISAVDSRTA